MTGEAPEKEGEANRTTSDGSMLTRKILDEQLGDTVLRFLHANGISDVQRSKSSTHLAELMRAERPRVIITTMQKFVKLDKVDEPIQA